MPVRLGLKELIYIISGETYDLVILAALSYPKVCKFDSEDGRAQEKIAKL